jgi:hypothetical protein
MAAAPDGSNASTDSTDSTATTQADTTTAAMGQAAR